MYSKPSFWGNRKYSQSHKVVQREAGTVVQYYIHWTIVVLHLLGVHQSSACVRRFRHDTVNPLVVVMLSHHLLNGNHHHTEESCVPFDPQHQASPPSVVYSGYPRPRGVHINVQFAGNICWPKRCASSRTIQWRVSCFSIMEDWNGNYFVESKWRM